MTKLTVLLTTLALATSAWADDDHRSRGDGRGYGDSRGHDDDHHDPRSGYGVPVAPPPYAVSGVTLTNRAGVEADVWIDGVFRGGLRCTDARSFTERPGTHDVLVRARDGLVLFQGRVVLSPRGLLPLDVVLPLATLTLVNDGQAPLWVTVGRDAQWILPGARYAFQVPAGLAHVTTAMYGRGGLVPVSAYDVRTLPGRPAFQSIGFAPPPRDAQVLLTNHESTTVRLYVDGREVVALRPGESRAVNVPLGRHDVLLVEQRGRVLYQAPVDVRGGRTEVTIWNGVNVSRGTTGWVALR